MQVEFHEPKRYPAYYGGETRNKVIDHLAPEQQPKWGKMSADQMLAHCNVAYAFVFEPQKFKKPGTIKKWVLKKP